MEIAIILNSGVPVTREIGADKIICADGGYRLCPVRPDYLVGDSRTESPRCILPRSSAPTSSPCTA